MEKKLRPYSDYVRDIKATPGLRSYTIKSVRKVKLEYKLDLFHANKQVCKKQEQETDFVLYVKKEAGKPEAGMLVLIKFGGEKVSIKFYSQTGKYLFGE